MTACAPLACALNVTILADTNRDGIIDAKTDAEKKAEWSETRGALFLPNIGDADAHCHDELFDVFSNLNHSLDLSVNTEILGNAVESCNDASDDTQRNPQYLAPILVLANCKVSPSATGSVHVTNDLAAKKVRIFQKDGDAWKYIAANHIFTAQELRKGLSLGIDARDVRRAGGWDGTAVVHMTVTDGAEEATDAVAFRVAPVLTHHHAQDVEQFMSTAAADDDVDSAQAYFVKQLEKDVADAGFSEPVTLMSSDEDEPTTQDYFESGYASIPGPHGPVVIRIVIRSAQWHLFPGVEAIDRLRSDTVGAVQQPLLSGSPTDSLGNLETIPPYTHNGKSYPAGRIIMGAVDGVKPLIFPFLEAQEFQVPLLLDVSWLATPQVDKFLQFLPADNERGWVLMINDPNAGLELLARASRDGHGGLPAVSRPVLPTTFGCKFIETVDEVLGLAEMAIITRNVTVRIEDNIAILKRETGLSDDEIFRVPALFYPVDHQVFNCDEEAGNTAPAVSDSKSLKAGPAGRAGSIIDASLPLRKREKELVRRQENFGRGVLTVYPNAINSIVLTANHTVLAPNPFGPVIDGVDIIAEAITAAYARVNFKVTYIDDWFSHYMSAGDVHDGTNVWRDASMPWWG
ncbi:hypothetical protein ACHAP6_004169 [Verticillium nonalfalfae]